MGKNLAIITSPDTSDVTNYQTWLSDESQMMMEMR